MDIHQENILELQVNEDVKASFYSVAQWALINAVVGFISLSIAVVNTIVVISTGTPSASSSLIILLVTITLSLLLNVTLLGAAQNIKNGIQGSDQLSFNNGLFKLSNYLKIIGILMIITTVIVSLVLVIAVVAGITE